MNKLDQASLQNQILLILNAIYPEKNNTALTENILTSVRKGLPIEENRPPLKEDSIYLITYGDAFSAPNISPLAALHRFAKNYLTETVSDIHLLPMYPFSSDDGFSVIDYYQVDPASGSWSDIRALSHDFSLMFDCVINHISKHSQWFTEYLKDNPDYQRYFIEADIHADYQNAVRPRTTPLLTPFTHSDGRQVNIWTTFSDDQIDLNFKEPRVLLESINILLFYAAQGATSIRLDAIGFIWKEPGERCIHQPQVHLIIKLWRLILDTVFPGCRIITETNVPHHENIAYFGQGDEAHMVYQFPLPPLTLHAFLRGNARWLREWSRSLERESLPAGTTFFNFIASHDGIGIRPTENLLEDSERDFLVSETLRKNGRVSWKNNGDGTASPYELNINYLSALSEPNDNNEIKTAKMLAAHAILFSLKGVPALYYHSLLGSENDQDAVEQSGINRRINRQKLSLARLETELSSPENLRAKVFSALHNMLQIRKNHPAFSPWAEQKTLLLADAFFAVERCDQNSGEKITCIVNVSAEHCLLQLDIRGNCLLSHRAFNGELILAPWQTLWVKHSVR
ncbi:sugar phosphorylase [Citrobacter amalonaticus]|uniref:Sugar phosphorylase n=1 Tax=Citrobacter amalonaticus TaxID=35703 RepID=A0A2S4RXD5_CITAM|nr:sugar phosphorylase [Citrobacter amalonaticus]POT56016.1 sugar phosphorylase [Citrobacter amalonaticus]POT74324.1 sugar phosphorylase [Citrobacter amalonaticus]POU65125.1 sugar phosphorylase [Citrobacter amalonaticus]POV03959.1 sugar phosphorylase [Citrobacter amalonaticus]